MVRDKKEKKMFDEEKTLKQKKKSKYKYSENINN